MLIDKKKITRFRPGVRWVFTVCIVFLLINISFSVVNHFQQREMRQSISRLITEVSESPIYMSSNELLEVLNAQRSFDQIWSKTVISQAVMGIVIALIVFAGQVLISSLYEEKIKNTTDHKLAISSQEVQELEKKVKSSISLVCAQEPPVWAAGDGDGLNRRVRALNALADIRPFGFEGVEYYLEVMTGELVKDITGLTYKVLFSNNIRDYEDIREYTFDPDIVRGSLGKLQDEAVKRMIIGAFRDRWGRSMQHIHTIIAGSHYQKLTEKAKGDRLQIDDIYNNKYEKIYSGLVECMGL